jgi:hypothetical protein
MTQCNIVICQMAETKTISLFLPREAENGDVKDLTKKGVGRGDFVLVKIQLDFYQSNEATSGGWSLRFLHRYSQRGQPLHC